MVLRPDALSRHGGDVVQAEGTARALRSMGVNVTLSAGESLESADLVHVFNLQTPDWTLSMVRAAKRLGKPVALSPVYWSRRRFLLGAATQLPFVLPCLPHGWRERPGAESGRQTAPLIPLGHRRAMQEVLRSSSVLLPNSEAEAEHLMASFPELRKRRDAIHVVPNGVDVEAYDRSLGAAMDPEFPSLPDEFLLCVARIDFRKNQLRLIRASERLGLSLVCAGSPVGSSAWHRAYHAACRRAGRHVTFLGQVPQDRLWPLYARCAVHCLPSYFETPGLSNLEAALAGARLITTPWGSTREYLGDDAVYADPGKVSSISAAVERALASKPSPCLAERIRERYSWPKAAEATYRAYSALLS